ncbi:MAG: acyl-CoA thioesterase/BAAT N-terminal domain-containing protein [Chloroflexi bacterium]|nr:acyl-CoA thioesterase/BAAT N-terminal domain-containing protein [Chloroflexota bacterium]MBV9599665.1 acyl-CoA thioesterase/BAAT N-terminal domain-containing protein [Chloroflexota bacterium]
MTRSGEIHVDPPRSMVDEPLRIWLDGFEPGQRVTLRASQTDDLARTWRAHATFVADANGRIDVSAQAPVSGTYADADAMGLIWSMQLAADEPNQAPFFRKEPTPLPIEVVAEVDAAAVARTAAERVYVADGVERIPVHEDGLVGTLFVPPGHGPHPVVITLSGSGGGLSESGAALYASHGYAGFALAYFNYADLPPDLIEIPLEYFETGIRWVQRQSTLDGDRIGVSGTSRGGELVLLLGATFPAVRAVIAYVPSGIVHGGIARSGVRGASPAWTFHGEAVPYLQPRPERLSAEPPAPPKGEPIPLTPRFLRNLEDQEAAERAEIPVERINGPVLLISGKDDAMWPSERMAEIARRRLEAHHFPHPYKHLAYAGAGHMIGTPYLPTTVLASRHPLTGEVFAYGGTPKAYAAAREDSWREILKMLLEAWRSQT